MKMEKLIDTFRQRQRIYQRDPVVFAQEIVACEPDEWQTPSAAASVCAAARA